MSAVEIISDNLGNSMSEHAKHTPGPWEWARCDDGDFAFLKGDGLYVLTPENIPGAAAWVDISDANARLIAESPELLSIVKDALSSFRCTQRPEHYPSDHWSNRALAALAKVEGR